MNTTNTTPTVTTTTHADGTTSLHVICPECGADIELHLAKHEHAIHGAIAIGEDSGLGKLFLAVKGHTLSASHTAGASAPSAAASAPAPDTRVAGAIQSLICSGIEGTDPVITALHNAPTLRESHLFKQHILGQLFDAVISKERIVDERGHITYTYNLDKEGLAIMSNEQYNHTVKSYYFRAWRVLIDRLCEQNAEYRHHDDECFAEDNRWYNKALALAMFDQFYAAHRKEVEALKVHRCSKGKNTKTGEPNRRREYVRPRLAYRILGISRKQYKGIFIDELQEVYFSKFEQHRSDIENAANPIELHHAVAAFFEVMPPLVDWHIEVCREYINAYKGFGCYHAMKNLILFHGCHLHMSNNQLREYGLHHATFNDSEKHPLTTAMSLTFIRQMAENHKAEGWWMFGAFKALIKDNHFDIIAKRREWYEAYKVKGTARHNYSWHF